MIENLYAVPNGTVIVSYRAINRFWVAEGMQRPIRDLFHRPQSSFKMEELVTFRLLFIDGTKISQRQV